MWDITERIVIFHVLMLNRVYIEHKLVWQYEFQLIWVSKIKTGVCLAQISVIVCLSPDTVDLHPRTKGDISGPVAIIRKR